MNVKKLRLSTDQFRASLHIPNPVSHSHLTTDTSAPVAAVTQLASNESLIRLHIDMVTTYRRNPRTVINERFLEIKESIRACGLDNLIKVTKRTGDAMYFPVAGGNTRILALKALFQETKDDRYGYHDFLFTPYISESDVLARHFIENDTRSDLVFWDKANAIAELKREIQSELGQQVSGRQLVGLLGEKGIQVGREMVRVFSFASDKLCELGPAAVTLSGKTVRGDLMPAYFDIARLAAKFDLTEEVLDERVVNPVLRRCREWYEERNEFEPLNLCSAWEGAIAHEIRHEPAEISHMLAVLEKNPAASRAQLLPPLVTHVAESNGRRLADGSNDAGCESLRPAPDPVIQVQPQLHSPRMSGGGTAASDMLYATDLTPGDHTQRRQASSSVIMSGTASPQTEVRAAILAFAQVTDLQEYLRFDDGMPLGFYVELPRPMTAGVPLDIESATAGCNAYRYMAWWYLTHLSGVQTEGTYQKLQADSPLACALASDEIWEQQIRCVIGEPQYPETFGALLDWVLDAANPAGQALLALLAALRDMDGKRRDQDEDQG
ncbi:hypothetical protein [Herbaspirillum autotrophicum]|uniref:hypothetical protein n=1 Tax=Herbaspirillum autotrophicum TaxID=180195 RepID=UPI00067D5A2D|nr:hypothetical protein [Herbaspirillum autotrophicum]